MSAPKATVVGPIHYPNGDVVASTWLTLAPVGPPGQILRSSDAAIMGESTVLVDAAGNFAVQATSNEDVDRASGVTGTSWVLLGAEGQRDRSKARVSWRFRVADADDGTTIPLGAGSHVVAPGSPPPGWSPGGGRVDSVVAGVGVTVDDTDPARPVVSATGGPGSGVASVTATNGVVNTGTATDPVLEVSGLTLSDISDAGTAAAADTTDFRAASGRVDAADVDLDTSGFSSPSGTIPAQAAWEALDQTVSGHILPIIQVLGTASTHNVPASGDAAAGEVVLGDDSRLADVDALKVMTPTVKTADYTFALGDMNGATVGNKATALTFTIPTHVSVAFPVGAVLPVNQMGDGQITVVGAAGVTITALNGSKTAGKGAMMSVWQRAVDDWVIFGDTTA